MSLKKLQETWDIRAVILLSLLLQIILIFFAPLRKRTSKWYISMPMWLAYLCAEIVALYVVGLISRTHRIDEPKIRTVNREDDPKSGMVNHDLVVFWAPVLLGHLGGPDTITAFALEDNELWLRHLLTFGSQIVIVAYVVILDFPKNKLVVPALLVYFSGAIKYLERILCLYRASSNGFRQSLLTDPDPGPNYAKLMDELSSKKENGLPTTIKPIPKHKTTKNIALSEDEMELTDLQVIQRGHDYFNTFKGLIADLIFSFRERRASREFFLKRNSRQAFKIVEVELNFMYEALYTKVPVLQGRFGYIPRITSFVLDSVALLLFIRDHKGKGYSSVDIAISYVLLAGAIALDLVAFTTVIFSDRTAVVLSKPGKKTRIKTFFLKVLVVDISRWSNTISQYNLVDCCLSPWPKFFADIGGVTKILDSVKHVVTMDCEDELRDLIFKEIKMKAELAEELDTARGFYSARGDWILHFTGNKDLIPWVSKVDFDESLLMWHIATDLLYSTTDCEAGSRSNTVKDFRRFSKMLSDYMLYLLIMETNMMSAVAGIGLIRYRDTCAETMRFFRRRNIIMEKKYCCPMMISCFGKCSCGDKSKPERTDSGIPSDVESHDQNGETSEEAATSHAIACKNILAVDTAVKPVSIKGDRSKSLLFDASMLAKELRDLGKDDHHLGRNRNEEKKKEKWEIVFKVWVEIMCYAATHCRASAHAGQLSKGGQLITLVWLLMTHFGFGNQFQISGGHERVKLVASK